MDPFNLLCMIEVRLLSIPNSLTGQKNWESLCDPEQHTRLGVTVKSKPKINILPVIGETFWTNAGNNCSSLAPKFAFAHKTSVNYATGKTDYEIVFVTKPQIPKFLELGLYCNKHKFCCSKFCKDLPSHSHSENNLKNQLLDNLLRPQLWHALLERERDFKRIYSATFERCREQTARSHAYRNRFKLGQHLDVGQKVLYENHRQDLSNSQKLQHRRLGPFTVTKRVTNTTYKIQDDKDPTIFKTVHRIHLVEYYHKEETLPPW